MRTLIEDSPPASRASDPRREWLLTAGLCVLLAVAAYHQRIAAYFFQDDLAMIAHGVECWRDGDLLRLLSTDQWNAPGYNRLRPLTLSAFALLYHTAGLRPVAFRAVNLTLFALSGVLVAWLTRRRSGPGAARLAAVVFLTWPSLTNAVYPVCTLTDVGAGFFALLTGCLYTHAHARARRSTWLWALPLAGLCYLLSQLSKETGIVCLPLAVLAGRFLAGRSWRASLMAALPLGMLASGYMLWRLRVFSALVTGPGFHFVDVSAKSWVWRYVFFWFETLVGLNLDTVKDAAGPRGILFVAVGIIAVSGIVMAAAAWIGRRLSGDGGVRFSVAAFLATLAPVIYYPSGRNLYVPLAVLSIGIGHVLATFFERVRENRAARAALLAGLVALGTWRLGVIGACCRNNGRAGDLFHRIVVQLDDIASGSATANPRIDVFAPPAEILTPFLLDTPWVICGGEARQYEELTYGAARADFRYHLFTTLRRVDTPPSIEVQRPRPDSLTITLGPQVEFHWGESFADPARDYGAVRITGERTPYRDPIPERVEVMLAPDLLGPGHLLVGFDGRDMRLTSCCR
jgi:hypothetical protein